MTLVVMSYVQSRSWGIYSVHLFLSFQLLDHEVHAKDQVPLLMEMKKADVALDKAIESGDPQLGTKHKVMT